MTAASVSRILSLIPDRLPRMQTGCAFDPHASATCAHPERIAHLAQFLNWLGPLHPVSKDDLRIFGLLTPYGARPTLLAPEDSDDEEDVEPALESPVTIEEAAQPAVLP